MKQLTFLSILFLAFYFAASAQSIRPEIAKLATEMAKDDMYKSQYVGNGGVESEQWKRFNRLKQDATIEELITLTEHSSGVVRCYSFEALASRNYSSVYPIVLNHLHDTVEIRTIMGCMIEFQTVGDFFIEHLPSPGLSEWRILEFDDLQEKIDSILIFDKQIQLTAKNDLLRTLKPEEKYYTRIREMVVLEKSNYALTTLSKYRKTIDLPFILEALKDKNIQNQRFGLIAAKNFPHDSLFPYLKEIHWAEVNNPDGGFDSRKLRFLYQALVQYDSQEAQQLIRQTSRADFKVTNLGYHHQNIWLALQLHPNALYAEIPNQLVLSEQEKKNLNYWIENPDLF